MPKKFKKILLKAATISTITLVYDLNNQKSTKKWVNGKDFCGHQKSQ